MAKNQGLSLNPGKISGLCGRLMRCLSYENDYYAKAHIEFSIRALSARLQIIVTTQFLSGEPPGRLTAFAITYNQARPRAGNGITKFKKREPHGRYTSRVFYYDRYI